LAGSSVKLPIFRSKFIEGGEEERSCWKEYHTRRAKWTQMREVVDRATEAKYNSMGRK